MNILYVLSRPLEINTSASIRNRATILGLIELGHNVDLFTTQPDQNHNAYDKSMTLEGVHITYVKLQGIQQVARIGRRFAILAPLKKLVYNWMSRFEIYDNLKGIINFTDQIDLYAKQYDCIISSSDPKSSHLFVERLLEMQNNTFRGKWIQIWGDPFVGDITLKAKHKQSKIRREECRLLSKADKVVYVSPLTLQEQKRNYPESADKMVYYPIPYLQTSVTENRSLQKARPVKLLYCGDYGSRVRDIIPLYEAVKEMNDVHLTVCGSSDQKLDNCEQVSVNDRVEYSRVTQMEKEADILVHLSNRHGNQIPGKIYQLSATNKPILFILDGNSKSLRDAFSRFQRYEFADNSKKAIEVAINRLILGQSDMIHCPVKAFSKETVAAQILEKV